MGRRATKITSSSGFLRITVFSFPSSLVPSERSYRDFYRTGRFDAASGRASKGDGSQCARRPQLLRSLASSGERVLYSSSDVPAKGHGGTGLGGVRGRMRLSGRRGARSPLGTG